MPPTVTSRVTPEYASTRNTRVTNVYVNRSYGGWSYHPYQSDPFHPMLTGYLLGRLSQPTYYGGTRDWVYANYDTMDPIRREELFRENAQLRNDIARMRANSVPVQQVSLGGMDPDLLYNDQAAQTLYVPVRSDPSFWRVMGWITLIGMVGFLLWAIFNVKSEFLGKWGR